MSGDAAEMLTEARNWPEHQLASQLVFAFKRVLVTMPESEYLRGYILRVE